MTKLESTLQLADALGSPVLGLRICTDLLKLRKGGPGEQAVRRRLRSLYEQCEDGHETTDLRDAMELLGIEAV